MSIRNHNRRTFLKLTSSGVSAFALSNLINAANTAKIGNGAALRRLHHARRAKSVILLYMSGGVSHVDSFDPKPRIKQLHGQPLPMTIERTQFDNNGNLMASPWDHKQYGQSGLTVTDMFPRLTEHVDDMAIVRSMTANFSEHSQGNYFMHSGFPFLGYPSVGSWVTYGLGTENPNLPGYIVLQSKLARTPHGGVSIFGNGFLPATTQGSIFNISKDQAVPNVTRSMAKREQRRALDYISQLDRNFAGRVAAADAVSASIKNAETAFHMQEAVPELTNISGESAATRKLYGIDDDFAPKAEYARQCLIARRLVERGVRFVELSCAPGGGPGGGGAGNPWDQHGDLEKGHRKMAAQVDQPIAGLLKDLKQRGLLDDTLVVFTGEFGRTPFSQGTRGRDHNPFGFSLWLAGGGIQGGQTYGATDEFGYKVQDRPATVYDLWATVLHQLGIDHENLTYRWSGRDLRLTDVHGQVWHELLA